MIAEPVIQYLRQLEVQGQTHISVDDEARSILREFYIRAQGKTTTPHPPKPVVVTKEPSKPIQVTPAAAPSLSISGNNAAEKIVELKLHTANLPSAKALGTLRQTMVFSTGNPEADIMLVGEAPGFDDERIGEPFIGKAGQKLTGILQAMGCKREDVYLSHLVKYRPSSANQTTMTRKPSAKEIAAFMPIFNEEIKIVAPKIIIALGATPAQALLASESSVSDLRGKFHEYQGIQVRATYHPSYILQDGNTPEKRELWEDMLAVMELLKMPINDKQRGYFLKK